MVRSTIDSCGMEAYSLTLRVHWSLIGCGHIIK